MSPLKLRYRGGSALWLALGLALLMGLVLIPAGPAMASVQATSASDDAQAPKKGNLFVLTVGVDNYTDANIPDLSYTDDDARAIVWWAQSQEGLLYERVYTHMLTGIEATKPELLEQILDFFRAAGPGDQIILFLAGHGVVQQELDSYHFLTSDAKLDNIVGTGVEQRDILDKLVPTHKRGAGVLVLLDSCHAGKLGDALTTLNQPAGLSLSASGQGAVPDDLAQGGEQHFTLITAGSAVDAAVEGPSLRLPEEPAEIKGHGVFTHALLVALVQGRADLNHDGRIQMYELITSIEDTMRALPGNQQTPGNYVRSGRPVIAAAPLSVDDCDGIDNDFDGEIDEDATDANGNGIPDCAEVEVCNGQDDDDDGFIDEGFDADGDGFPSIFRCPADVGTDCDDGDQCKPGDTRCLKRAAEIHPGQADLANIRDDDCDGLTDEDAADWDNDGLPDFYERRYNTLKVGRIGAFILAGSTALTAAIAYGFLVDLERDENADCPPTAGAECYSLPAAYAHNYVLTSKLTTAGMFSAGISLTAGLLITPMKRAFEREIVDKSKRVTDPQGERP